MTIADADAKLPIDGLPRPRNGWTGFDDDPAAWAAIRATALAVRTALLALPGAQRDAAMYLTGICYHCGGDDAEKFKDDRRSCQCWNDE